MGYLSKSLRFRILERDNFRCSYCGRGKNDGVVLHVDHKEPKCNAGSDADSNLVAACADCNHGKGPHPGRSFSSSSIKVSGYSFRSRQSNCEFVTKLKAYWEVSYDPISDDYTPDEITAGDLLCLWAERVHAEYPNGLIPIYWFVASEPEHIFESMPGQADPFRDGNFLTRYTTPLKVNTGEEINWLQLPVIDKLWRSRRANKGGFIQEATGWKPSVLQPEVHLKSLSLAMGKGIS